MWWELSSEARSHHRETALKVWHRKEEMKTLTITLSGDRGILMILVRNARALNPEWCQCGNTKTS